MTHLVLDRITETAKSTKGRLRLMHNKKCVFECAALELPWRENKRRVSRIPAGEWEVSVRKVGKYYSDYRRKFAHEFVLEIIVDGRTAILIHIGNYPRNTLGCVLTGVDTGKADFIGASTTTYKAFYQAVSKNLPDRIIIRDEKKCPTCGR